MQIKSLNTITSSELVECAIASFADYFMKVSENENHWVNRWNGGRVNRDLSFGMFDQDRLVGFIINGIDMEQGRLTAFNVCTGVLPAYRRQRIVTQLYDFAIPHFKSHGIKNCALEVITKNEKAIKAYRNTGFTITKGFKCFAGNISPTPLAGITLEKKSIETWNWDKYGGQTYNSWENRREAVEILKHDYELYEADNQKQPFGYFVINPLTGYLAQFGVSQETQENWQNLFGAISSVSMNLRIINVDERLTNRIEALEMLGFENIIGQYQMEMVL